MDAKHKNCMEVRRVGPDLLGQGLAGEGVVDSEKFKNTQGQTSLVVQWLRLHAPTAAGAGSISDWGSKKKQKTKNKTQKRNPKPKQREHTQGLKIAEM